MVCYTYRSSTRQTETEREKEVADVIAEVESRLANRRAKVIVGPQGAIMFQGIDDIRAGVADACVARKIMSHGSGSAKMAIAAAERQSGRQVNLAAGMHSHDGRTWHHNH